MRKLGKLCESKVEWLLKTIQIFLMTLIGSLTYQSLRSTGVAPQSLQEIGLTLGSLLNLDLRKGLLEVVTLQAWSRGRETDALGTSLPMEGEDVLLAVESGLELLSRSHDLLARQKLLVGVLRDASRVVV